MFEKIFAKIEDLSVSVKPKIGQGNVEKIILGNKIDNWVGWYSEQIDIVVPIYIFNHTKFKDFHFETSRMTLTYKEKINVTTENKAPENISGLTLFGSNFSNLEFSIVAGTLNSLIYENKVEIKDIENLMLLLERALGREKVISRESIIGLWGEISVIDFAKDTEKFILGWAKEADSLHDFTFENYPDVEVKTTLGNNRIHYISSDQVENQEKNTIFLSIISREIDNGKSIIDIFSSINNKIDLTQEAEKAITLKNILLNKCLDRIGDALFLSSFLADQELARKSIGAFYADELGIPNISKPVIKAKYQVEISEKEISNSTNILELISTIFI
jgi:hypothetical protein